MAISARWKRGSLVLALLLACGAAAAAWNYDALVQWLTGAGRTATITVSGNIEAHQSVLGFKTVQSRIVELPLNEGQWVNAGQLISRLDDSDYRQQVVMAEAALAVQRRQLAAAEQNLAAAKKTVESDAADLELAKVEFSRTTGLTRIGAASVEARDQANAVLKKANAAIERDRALEAAAERQVELAMANIRNAEESLKLAKIVLDYTVLAAPFDGVITVRQAELGEVVVPGTPVVTLADLDHIWLRAYIAETDLGKIHWGQDAAVTTDTYPGKQYHGRISFISRPPSSRPRACRPTRSGSRSSTASRSISTIRITN